MRKILDQIATQHRNWEAISTAVVLLGVLAWAGLHLRSARLVERTSQIAIVTRVQPGAAENQRSWGQLTLSDSTTVELLLPDPVPAVGDPVPLLVELLADDSRSYSVDLVKWRTGEFQ